MATAAIRIDQPTHATQPTGVAGRARDDIELGEAVTLRNGNNSGVDSWRWELLARPTASTARLSNPILSTCTFTPDVVGTYRVKLSVNEGLEGEVAITVAIVRDADGLRVPAAYEGITGSEETNYLIDGSPNTLGPWPDFEAYLLHLAALAGDVADVAADLAALDTRVDALETTTGTHETRLDALEAEVDALDSEIVYDLDFTAQATNTLVDGNETIDGRTWVAANIASRTTLAVITNGTGLRMTHVNGSTSQLASADTAPRISIALSDLIPSYSPLRRYFFLVQYSWAVTPDAAGERFSLGIVGAAASPWPSTALRFAGATASYNATALAPTHEGERTNTILNGQAPEQVVLGFSLDGPKTFTIWQATSMPTATLSGLVPVAFQQSANATAGGDYDIFHYAAGRLTLALAATGSAAIHSVIVTRLRIIRSRS